MAKDGTNRGGRRVRAGDKPDALADKIARGKAAQVMDLPITDLDGADDLGPVSDLTGADMPHPSDYLSAKQRDGEPLGADIIFNETIRHASDLQIGAFKDNDIYMATGKKEREANVFAADFLIQDEDVLKRMKACDSNFFNVAKALRIPAPFFAFKLYSMVERGYAMRMPVDLDSAFLARKGN